MHEYYITYRNDGSSRSTYLTIHASSRTEAINIFKSSYPELIFLSAI